MSASAKRRTCSIPGLEVLIACSEILIRCCHSPPPDRIADNLYCFGTNTSVDDVELKPQEVMTVDIEYPRFPLQRGTYDLTVGVFDPTMQKIYETTEHILDFQAVQDDGAEGVTFIEHTWQQQEQVR